MTLHDWDGVTVLDLGEMDIWDGADMSLLRETLLRLIEGDKRGLIGVNMQSVKYIPSGFFGMLYDWHEKGVEVFLYSPQPNVANMLWFRQFFEHVENGCHVLRNEPKYEMPVDSPKDWQSEPARDDRKEERQRARRSIATAHRK